MRGSPERHPSTNAYRNARGLRSIYCALGIATAGDSFERLIKSGHQAGMDIPGN